MTALLDRLAPLRTLTAAAVAGALLALLALPFLGATGSEMALVNHILITIVFAMSFNMIFGFAGMLSFGHAVYFGLPAFATIALMNVGAGNFGIPVPLLPVAGFCIGGALGWIGGFICTRQTGASFAMITLGIGEMVVAATYIFSDVFGGEEGLSADRTALPAFLGADFRSAEAVYFLLLFWTIVSVLAMTSYLRTAQGQLAQAVRDNAERVASVGYRPGLVRRRAFAISAAFAGLAGALYAIQNEFVTTANVSLHESGHVIFVTYIGGAAHPLGPALGAVVLSMMEWTLRDLSEAWPIYIGAFFVAMVLFARRGLAGALAAHAALPGRAAALALWRPYLETVAALAAFLFVFGFIVEAAYYLSFAAPFDPSFRYFGIAIDPKNFAVWPALLAALAGLCVFLSGRWRRSRRAFEDVVKGGPQ